MKINSTDEMAVVTGLPMFGAPPDFGRFEKHAGAQTGPVVTETFRGMWLAMRSLERMAGRFSSSSEIAEGKPRLQRNWPAGSPVMALACCWLMQTCAAPSLRGPRAEAGALFGIGARWRRNPE
jgi:hypothetical protein